MQHDSFGGGTISEWCKSRNFSRSTFYRLPDDDKPVVIYLRRKPLITAEADRDWWERMNKRYGSGAGDDLWSPRVRPAVVRNGAELPAVLQIAIRGD